MSAPARYVFAVSATDPVQRLDTLVVTLLGREQVHGSRSMGRGWVEQGRVLVDGAAAKPAGKVRAGVRIEVEPAAGAPSQLGPDPTVAVQVLYEDAHLLVIDKPAGLVVHPARGHATGTLVHGLLARGTFSGEHADLAVWETAERPGIVHRLDKDTSGVMVVARTVPAREGLKKLFSRHDLEREYVAVVVGHACDATYDTPHGRHPTSRLRFTSRLMSAERRAVTRVRVLERLAQGRATLVSCTLETGRTHQIRVHMAECSRTPVLGDALYGTRVRDAELAAIGKQLGRQWLHAQVLGFVHPITKQPMRFCSPPPRELRAVLEQLRQG